MSNIVTFDGRPDLPGVSMSNGVTYVFISTLAMALSAAARTDREIRMAIWIATHDQNKLGHGWMDFDLSDMPWNAATFDADKALVLSAVDLALTKFGWDLLGYEPREDWLLQVLQAFRTLLAAFERAHIRPFAPKGPWEALKPAAIERCERDGTYKHAEGCVVCNDLPRPGRRPRGSARP